MSEEEIVQEEVEETTEVKQIDPQVVERARLQGWVPEEEFRGDKARWIPADEFVNRADHIMPILKSTNKKLETKLEEIERKLKEKDETLQKIVKIQTKYADDFHTTRISEFEEKKRQAVAEGNIEEYDRISKEQQKIAPPEKIDIKPNDVPDGMQKWFDENRTWFGVDQELTEAARDLGDLMAHKNDPLAAPGREYEMGNAVKEKLKRLFPDKFKNPNQNRQEFDETQTRETTTTNNKKKGWNDLPSEAKTYWTNSGQHIPGFTLEKYLKEYFEG